MPFFSSPPFISSIPPNMASDTLIDLVFVDFIESQLLQVFNTVQMVKTYTGADVLPYSPILANEVLGLYAQVTWN
jgi:hypothetical protein